MQISRTINLISFLFPWVFSTFASIAATLVCSSSVCLPLHAACHPDSAECLWHCHLDVMSYFFPVTQPRCLSTGLSATQQLELRLMYFTDARILFFFFFKKRLGSYNPLNQIRKMNTASYSFLWSWLCFRMEWETSSWTRMGFAWRESASFFCLCMLMRFSPEG